MNNRFIKIILPAILTIVLFVVIFFFYIIPSFHYNLMLGKKEMIKELVSSAWSIMNKYDIEYKNGIRTKESAQNIALSEIKSLRYGEDLKDYFWITDMQPKMIVHPFRQDLNKKDLSNYTDLNGKKIFVEFVKLVKEQNEGYVDYMWYSKNDTSQIVPKLSFVKRFEPWEWVVGTGIYLDDVETEIKSLTSRLTAISVVISGLIFALLFIIYFQSLKIEQKRIKVVYKLKLQNEELMLSRNEAKKNEKKILESIVRTEEKEKERFAKDLHDGLGPILSTCKIYIHTLANKLGENPDLEKYTSRAGELLDDGVKSIKEISNNLSPHLLRNYGLTNAINSFVNNLELLHRIEFKIDLCINERLSDIVEFTIYRVITELINNTLKYAEASIVEIKLDYIGDKLNLSYKDNGKGFDLDNNQIASNKYGLLNIQNRIKKLNGTFNYQTSPGKGVNVSIVLNSKKREHD